MNKKIAVLVQNELGLDLNQIFSEMVSEGYTIDHIPLYHTKDPAEVIKAAKGYTYVVAGRETWSEEVLRACSPELKFIARFGAGFDTVDLEAAAKLGIAVSNAPGVNSKAVAEQTLALTLATLRKITVYDRKLRDGGVTAKMTQTLEGTVGIVGFGNIGQEFARLLQVFPVDIIAYDVFPNYEIAKEFGVTMVSLDEIVKRSDILSLHLPSCKDMEDFICAENIAKMKDGVYIINTSRGSVVNEHDLAEALRSGKVAAAALDAFKTEPLDPSSELTSLPNIVLTPHSAAVSTQACRSVFQYCAGAITKFAHGESVASILNPKYAESA